MIVTLDGISWQTLTRIKEVLGDDLILQLDEYDDGEGHNLYHVEFISAAVMVKTFENSVLLHTKKDCVRLSRFDYSQIILY